MCPDQLEPRVAGVGGDQRVGPAGDLGRRAAEPPHQLQRRLLVDHVGRVDVVQLARHVRGLVEVAVEVQLPPLGRQGGGVGRVGREQRVRQRQRLVPEPELAVDVEQPVLGVDVVGDQFEVADEQGAGGRQVRVVGLGDVEGGDGQRLDGLGVGPVVAEVLVELEDGAAIIVPIERGHPVGLDLLPGRLVAGELDEDPGPAHGRDQGGPAGQQQQSTFGLGPEGHGGGGRELKVRSWGLEVKTKVGRCDVLLSTVGSQLSTPDSQLPTSRSVHPRRLGQHVGRRSAK